MRSLPKPTDNASLILSRCLSSIQDVDLRNRVTESLPLISNSENIYDALGTASQLFSIPETNHVGSVTVDEMKSIYSRFRRKNGRARDIYDRIRLAAPNNICPLCNQLPVTTLDHHLSQSYHAEFVVTPFNLVPACKSCNLDTRARRPGIASEQTLHPYYHDVDDQIWLTATVLETNPPSLVFFANPPPIPVWPQLKREMVINHFNTFGLNKLYGTHAAVEMVNISYDIVKIYESEGAVGVRADLLERAANRRNIVRNSWQAATHQGLAESAWFCSEGFRYCLR